jgi:hypothetical protein
LKILADRQSEDPETWALVRHAAVSNSTYTLKSAAVRLLAERPTEDSESWKIVSRLAEAEPNNLIRRLAMQLLANGLPGPAETWQVMFNCAKDPDLYVRRLSMELLWRRLDRHPQIHELVRKAALSDSSKEIRKWAFFALMSEETKDRTLRRLLSQNYTGDTPAIDPMESVTSGRVKSASTVLGIEQHEVEVWYEELRKSAKSVAGIELTLEWSAEGVAQGI